MSELKYKNFIVGCLVLILLLASAIPFSPGIATASPSSSFDNVDVVEDLKSLEGFDFAKYSFNSNGAIKIINFVEYGYTYRANQRNSFVLYVYVYNPQALDISLNSRQNKIQLLVGEHYEKFELKLCSVSTGDYEKLYYKFKVVDREVNGKTFAERLDPDDRVYSISGIELLTRGNTNATEYQIGGTFKFTGYSKGCGPDVNAESTLSCDWNQLEVCTANVKSTYYRANMGVEKNHYNQVNTVYFEIPKRFIDEYGILQKIHAEWWEYKTKMAVVTADQALYNALIQLVGKELQENYNHTGIPGDYPALYDQSVLLKLAAGITQSQLSFDYAQWVYNEPEVHDAGTRYWTDSYSKLLPFVFYADPSEDSGQSSSSFWAGLYDNLLDFLYGEVTIGDVSGARLASYIYNYSNDLGHGYIDCNGRSISVDLFEDFVDDGHQMGYNNKVIDLEEDKFDILTWDSLYDSKFERALAKFFTFGFKMPETDGSAYDIVPIKIVEADDLIGTTEEVSKRLFISKDAVSDLQEMFASSLFEQKSIVLFRFSVTDYYSAYGDACFYNSNNYFTGLKENSFYASQQTVFFDFDVIDLTFNKEGEYHVIPMVASPIDIINSITAPPRTLNIWRLILLIVALVLIIVLLAPVSPYVIKAVIWIVALPFKLISKAVKSFKEHKNKSSTQIEDDNRRKG